MSAVALWFTAHPAFTGWLLATLLAAYRTQTPAQWVALGESIPRVQGVLKIARASGFDLRAVLEGAAQIVRGQKVVDPREALLAVKDVEIERLKAQLSLLAKEAP